MKAGAPCELELLAAPAPSAWAALFELRASSVRAVWPGHYSAAQIEAWLERPPAENGAVVVARIASEPAGFCSFDAARSEITGLYVSPEWGRRGVGRALLRAALHELERRGCSSASVWASKVAVAFYQRDEFRAMGWHFDQVGENLYIEGVAMLRRLAEGS